MENPEETLQILEDWASRRARSCGSGGFGALPRQLDEYLAHVARTGDPVFQWSSVKPLIKEKLLTAVNEFHETAPGLDVPLAPNVDPFNYEAMRSLLLERLDSFNAAPFTVQRLCELLTAPRKQYNRIDKFMRAVEKNVLVVSTREPGPVRREENEHIERTLNGSDGNSECGVDVDMEDTTWRDLRQPSTDPLAGVSQHENGQTDHTTSLPIETHVIPEKTSSICHEEKMEDTPSITTEIAKPDQIVANKEEIMPESTDENMDTTKEPEHQQIKEVLPESTNKEADNIPTPVTSSSEEDSNSNPEPNPPVEQEIEPDQKPESTTSGEDSSSSNSSENTDGESERGGGDSTSRSPVRSGMSEGDSSSEVPEKEASKQHNAEEKEAEATQIQTENYTIADIPTQPTIEAMDTEMNVEPIKEKAEEKTEAIVEKPETIQEENIEVNKPTEAEQPS